MVSSKKEEPMKLRKWPADASPTMIPGDKAADAGRPSTQGISDIRKRPSMLSQQSDRGIAKKDDEVKGGTSFEEFQVKKHAKDIVDSEFNN